MEESIVTGLVALVLVVGWICRVCYECGKEFTKQDFHTGRIQQEAPPDFILPDRPTEQAGFLLMHDQFIDNPPLEDK